jgi:hypothetical protein
MDESCTQLLSSDPMINLNTTVFFFLYSFPVCEESPQLGVSRPYNKDQSEGTRVREGSNTHKSTAIHTYTAKTWTQMNNTRFTTRTELKSLRMSIECAKTECEWSRMLRVCLVYSSMRLGVPFIAPRELWAVESKPGRLSLPSVGWCTGQSGAPPDTVRCWLLSYSGAADRWSFGAVGAGQSGAPIRPLARPRVTRGLRGWPLAWPTVGSPDSPVHHRTVRWIIVVRRRRVPESGQLTSASLVHPNRAESWLLQPRHFHFVFSLILALRQIC